ncbi:hypothetical protein B9Z55_000807 [Caenorhabditis nigoni]|uniref:SKP1 component POZ domain-containing protein n=1 Tax=Caenorhabditis nigoni TaxID=1611254 RepID=A0A2G5VV77_9PELO|nr:hypothetical protein B9Z55_000807 [Caenorhabditis nigoni]
MESSGERKLRFKTSDDQIIETEEKTFKLSQTIEDYIENNEGIPEEIPLESISSTTLKKIIKWLEYYNNHGFEGEILEASKILDINRLMRAGCAYMATLVRGSNVEEMKNFFAFDSDDDDEELMV